MRDHRNRSVRPGVSPLEGRVVMSSFRVVSAPALVRREPSAFRASFVGHFEAGPNRFDGFPFTVHVTSDEGGSSTSLHTSLRMAISASGDPDSPLAGQAVFIDRNVTTTGSTLILDLKADPGSLDARGRPTSATWTVDGASGGLYSNATGSGSVIISYRPGRPTKGAATSGIAAVRFTGQLVTTRLTNVINDL